MWFNSQSFICRYAISLVTAFVIALQASGGICHDLVGILHDTQGDKTPESVKSFKRAMETA